MTFKPRYSTLVALIVDLIRVFLKVEENLPIEFSANGNSFSLKFTFGLDRKL